jgi:predicted nucleic acid-binding protein
LHSGQRQVAALSELIRKAKLKGRQLHDARIAAVCLQNAVAVLWLVDHDFFGRFKALKKVNPLV